MVPGRNFAIWQLMRSAKHWHQQIQERFKCSILSHDAIRTVSAFAGKGKRSTQAVWRVYPRITESFNELSINTDTIGADNAAVLERFCALLNDRTTQLVNINCVRKELFTRKGTFAHENVPPTKAALEKSIPNKLCIRVATYGANPCAHN